MGLDNGICIRRNEKSMNIYDKLKRFEDDWDQEHKYDFEVCYWRKCWNIRALIFKSLDDVKDEGYTSIEHEDIPKIMAVLKSLNKDNWTDFGSCIWEWEEQEEYNEHYIENLKYLYDLMAEHDLDVYFYDSY